MNYNLKRIKNYLKIPGTPDQEVGRERLPVLLRAPPSLPGQRDPPARAGRHREAMRDRLRTQGIRGGVGRGQAAQEVREGNLIGVQAIFSIIVSQSFSQDFFYH